MRSRRTPSLPGRTRRSAKRQNLPHRPPPISAGCVCVGSYPYTLICRDFSEARLAAPPGSPPVRVDRPPPRTCRTGPRRCLGETAQKPHRPARGPAIAHTPTAMLRRRRPCPHHMGNPLVAPRSRDRVKHRCPNRLGRHTRAGPTPVPTDAASYSEEHPASRAAIADRPSGRRPSRCIAVEWSRPRLADGLIKYPSSELASTRWHRRDDESLVGPRFGPRSVPSLPTVEPDAPRPDLVLAGVRGRLLVARIDSRRIGVTPKT